MCRQTAGCNDRGLCRQTAVCSARTAKAYRRAWWKLPRGIRSILRVLSVWRLANGRLERPDNRGHFKGFKGFKRLKAGKRQAWTPQQQRGMCRQTAGCRLCRQTAGCNAGTAKAYSRAWWKEHFRGFKGFKGLKAGKGQAWTCLYSMSSESSHPPITVGFVFLPGFRYEMTGNFYCSARFTTPLLNHPEGRTN